MVYPALLPLMRTPRLPVVNWTDAHRRFKWTRLFCRKTKSGLCACSITFQTQSTTRHWVCVYKYVLKRALFNSGLRTLEQAASLVTMQEQSLLYGRQSIDEECSLYNVSHSLLEDTCTPKFSWVCRYTYGQPVKGQLHIKAIPQTPTWRQRKTKPPDINLMTEVSYFYSKTN